MQPPVQAEYEVEISADKRSIRATARLGAEHIGQAYVDVTQGPFWGLFGNTCYLSDIYVVRARQGQGHGSELLKRVEVAAKQQGCRCLELDTVPDARQFYRQQGYSRPWGEPYDSPSLFKYL